VQPSNREVIAQLFDLFGRGDREGAVGLFAEGAVFWYPGPGPLHGDYRGHDGIRRFWSEQDRYSGDRFRPELVDLGAGDRNVFALVRMGQEDGTSSWMRVVVYEVSDRKITGARVFEDDPSVAEAFFSKETETT
jgi:ketosteroid isomerase-like protein